MPRVAAHERVRFQMSVTDQNWSIQGASGARHGQRIYEFLQKEWKTWKSRRPQHVSRSQSVPPSLWQSEARGGQLGQGRQSVRPSGWSVKKPNAYNVLHSLEWANGCLLISAGQVRLCEPARAIQVNCTDRKRFVQQSNACKAQVHQGEARHEDHCGKRLCRTSWEVQEWDKLAGVNEELLQHRALQRVLRGEWPALHRDGVHASWWPAEAIVASLLLALLWTGHQALLLPGMHRTKVPTYALDNSQGYQTWKRDVGRGQRFEMLQGETGRLWHSRGTASFWRINKKTGCWDKRLHGPRGPTEPPIWKSLRYLVTWLPPLRHGLHAATTGIGHARWIRTARCKSRVQRLDRSTTC